jgi:uncharacterized protein YggT (Ycf19 family)
MPEMYQRTYTGSSRFKQESDYRQGDKIISVRDANPSITRAQLTAQYIIGILSGLLLVRFLLALYGADASNTFVNLIYVITGPLVRPFTGLFTIEPTSGTARFEIETLLATIVYIVIGLTIIRILDMFRKVD